MIPGPGGLDGGIEGQQIGLVGDVVDDADPLGDLLHGIDRELDGLTAFHGLLGGLAGHAIGDLGIVGVLVDAGAHLLDGGAGLFHA